MTAASFFMILLLVDDYFMKNVSPLRKIEEFLTAIASNSKHGRILVTTMETSGRLAISIERK
jgi:hypothetical protein